MKPTNSAATPIMACDGKFLKHDELILTASNSPTKEPTMRKLVFSIGALAIAFMVAFAWSHTVLSPSQAGVAGSINPTDLMSNHKGTLPIEQWEAI
ncbi:hypothetical protein JQ600_36545 [Bradyrhizobium sp. AUGA SZCCT0176]|uniref:hypothetical protein n=2 Tax=Bradyrhizobium TaxID=374 RepID=UPI001BABF156|nr:MULTISPECIES: hypothetical protein [unclassified Bradyrhizobium]MBR1230403.1 hypothetical protein [Bradyrhizobium sp. AUGA SZCCT0176]MBR1237081.1 hypothetical protein [Bradyrhizobium sp. AUGA SZCCT0182]MBR1287714.1 hypothetical protein [Bradyrhizobium sp. AUGA SZCCT0177]